MILGCQVLTPKSECLGFSFWSSGRHMTIYIFSVLIHLINILPNQSTPWVLFYRAKT